LDLAQLAKSQVLGDVLQEIKAGSVEVYSGGATVRYPATQTGAVPDRSGCSSGSRRRRFGALPLGAAPTGSGRA
jgi:hypothetical protein